MIVEHALLHIKPGCTGDFEQAMLEAKPLITCQPGFKSIELRRSSGQENQYLLLVEWDRIESHQDGFRKSSEYEKWRTLLHDFYEPMPSVEYFGTSLFND